MICCEAIFGRNAYEYLKANGRPFHFGKNAMQRLNALLNIDLKGQKKVGVTFDWSAYDTNCPKWII